MQAADTKVASKLAVGRLVEHRLAEHRLAEHRLVDHKLVEPAHRRVERIAAAGRGHTGLEVVVAA